MERHTIHGVSLPLLFDAPCVLELKCLRAVPSACRCATRRRAGANMRAPRREAIVCSECLEREDEWVEQ